MTIAIRPEQLGDYRLVATSREQLVDAHTRMLDWATKKLDQVDVDLDVESTNREIAAKNGWVVAPFERRIASLKRQRIFYDKIRHGTRDVTDLYERYQIEEFLATDAKKLKAYLAPKKLASPRQSPRPKLGRIA